MKSWRNRCKALFCHSQDAARRFDQMNTLRYRQKTCNYKLRKVNSPFHLIRVVKCQFAGEFEL